VVVQVNGEAQKTPEEMYAEVVIAQRVSKLRESSSSDSTSQNRTDGFIHMRCAAVAVSKYAPSLLAAWNAWDKIHRSENETPKIFPAHQPYMVFITADGGRDLEHFQVSVCVCDERECLWWVAAGVRWRETVGVGSVQRRSKKCLSFRLVEESGWGYGRDALAVGGESCPKRLCVPPSMAVRSGSLVRRPSLTTRKAIQHNGSFTI